MIVSAKKNVRRMKIVIQVINAMRQSYAKVGARESIVLRVISVFKANAKKYAYDRINPSTIPLKINAIALLGALEIRTTNVTHVAKMLNTTLTGKYVSAIMDL